MELRGVHWTHHRCAGKPPKGIQMKIAFKITDALLRVIRSDLKRPHAFAAERVGFIACNAAQLPEEGLIILAKEYHPVADEDYLKDWSVGAMMGPAAIRKSLQIAYSANMSMFHVHMHEHAGVPSFSRVDLKESQKFIPDFWNVQPDLPHGTLLLSHNSAIGLCWTPDKPSIVPITDITITGSPLTRFWRKVS